MPKTFSIHEDDLAELERTVPELVERWMPAPDNPAKVKIRRVQAILSKVRWNYGPHSDVVDIPADGHAS